MDILFGSYLVIHILNILVSLLLCFALAQRYIKLHLTTLVYLFSATAFWLIANSFFIIPSIWSSSLDPFFQTFSLVFQLVAGTLLIFFTEEFEGTKSLRKLLIPTVVTTALATLAIFSIYYNETLTMLVYYSINGNQYFNLSELIGIVILVITVLIGYWIFQELNLSMNNTISEVQERQIRLMKIGIINIFFFAPLGDILGSVLSTAHAVVIGFIVGQIVSYIFAIVGIAFIGFAYIYYDNIAFLQPEPIKSIMVIHDTGIPFFQYEFQQVGTPMELISGAISAVTVLMKEAFEVSSNLRGIYYQNEEILVEIKEDLAFILFIGHSSGFLANALHNFANSFYEKYHDQVDNFKGDISVFNPALDLFRLTFGLGTMTLRSPTNDDSDIIN